MIDAYNENANYGNVPMALFNSDTDYWMGVVSNKLCELDETCDPETGEILPNCLTLLQCADAVMWSTYHTLDILMEPYSCYEVTRCTFTDRESGRGTLSASIHSGQIHATSTLAEYYIYDRSYVTTYPVSHEVEGYIEIGADRKDIGPLTGINHIHVHDVMQFSGGCDGDDHICGIFAMGVTAQAATFEA